MAPTAGVYELVYDRGGSRRATEGGGERVDEYIRAGPWAGAEMEKIGLYEIWGESHHGRGGLSVPRPRAGYDGEGG